VRLPTWFSRRRPDAPPPTIPELRQRLDAARAEHAAADQRIEAARQRLDAERTADAIADLREARAERDDLAELMSLAEAELQRAEQAAEAERVAGLRRQRHAHRVRRDELVTQSEARAAEEARALLAVADIRAQRRAELVQARDLAAQATRISRGLADAKDEPEVSIIPATTPVCDLLEAERERTTDPDRREVLRQFIAGMDEHYWSHKQRIDSARRSVAAAAARERAHAAPDDMTIVERTG
jgi:hypothetical protein